jgi:hypothetical protein
MKRHGVMENAAHRCTFCGEAAMYSGRTNDDEQRGHDAHFCDACDVWLEARCDEHSCAYCHRRPLRPSMIKLERVDANAKGTRAYDEEPSMHGVLRCVERSEPPN